MEHKEDPDEDEGDKKLPPGTTPDDPVSCSATVTHPSPLDSSPLHHSPRKKDPIVVSLKQ